MWGTLHSQQQHYGIPVLSDALLYQAACSCSSKPRSPWTFQLPYCLPILVQQLLSFSCKTLESFPARSKQVAEALAASEALEATHTGPCDRVGEVGRMLRRFHKQANPTSFNLNHSINGVDQVGAARGGADRGGSHHVAKAVLLCRAIPAPRRQMWHLSNTNHACDSQVTALARGRHPSNAPPRPSPATPSPLPTFPPTLIPPSYPR